MVLGATAADEPKTKEDEEYHGTRGSVTGDSLQAELIKQAHCDEIDIMSEWEVGKHVPLSRARSKSGKPPPPVSRQMGQCQ